MTKLLLCFAYEDEETKVYRIVSKETLSISNLLFFFLSFLRFALEF